MGQALCIELECMGRFERVLVFSSLPAQSAEDVECRARASPQLCRRSPRLMQTAKIVLEAISGRTDKVSRSMRRSCIGEKSERCVHSPLRLGCVALGLMWSL